MVPFRSYVLSRFFKEEDTKWLDPFGEDEEEFIEDQKLFVKGMHEADYEGEDVEFVTRAMFRGYRGKEGEIRRRHSVGHTEQILPDDKIKHNDVVPSNYGNNTVVQLLDAADQAKDLIEKSQHDSQHGSKKKA